MTAAGAAGSGPLARVRATSLRIRLAALGGVVTAAVVWAAFFGLSVETRDNTRTVFTQQLERNQRTLRQAGIHHADKRGE